MKIQIEATPQITRIGGAACRVWEGVTESGVPCKVFVHRVAVHNDHDSAQFDRELAEQLPPGVAVDLRHVLPHLREVSRQFAALAQFVLTLPRNPERTVALRKLLEAKDAAVRAQLAQP